MALNQVFINAAKTIFKVFESLIHAGTYFVVVDDGFVAPTKTPYPVDVILDTFAERDVQFLSFSALLQPTDVKGLVRGEDLTGITVSTQDTITIGTDEYSIIAYNTDPAKAVYTFLLRNV